VKQRAHQRSRAFLGAKIVFNDRNSTFDCVIREISEGGAMIKVENALATPDHFTLLLSDGRRYECEVRWRRINSIGVQFLGAG
jgi:hypothetical protein